MSDAAPRTGSDRSCIDRVVGQLLERQRSGDVDECNDRHVRDDGDDRRVHDDGDDRRVLDHLDDVDDRDVRSYYFCNVHDIDHC